MAVTSFIPKVWAPKLMENYHRILVIQALASRDYEADLQEYGDTVHIGALTDATVRPYNSSNALSGPDAISGTDQTLSIDHATYCHVSVKDTDASETRVNLIEEVKAMIRRRLLEDMETYLLETISDGAGVTGTMDASGDLVSQIALMFTAMSQRNVPPQGRSLIVPSAFVAALYHDEKFCAGVTVPTAAGAKRGARCYFGGWDIYEDEDLVDQAIGLAPGALQIASKINLETYRIDADFATGVKGFLLAGAKVALADGCAVYSVS